MEIVNDLMKISEVFCTPNTSLKVVAKLMKKYNRGKMPVILNDGVNKGIIGIISTKDICFRSLGRGLNPIELTASDCMTSPVIVVRNDMLIWNCLKLMREKKFEILPVIDRNESICGEINATDIENFLNSKDRNFIHPLVDNLHQLQSQ
jgi:CBS domain-containing protein